jgi:hypothetical protein
MRLVRLVRRMKLHTYDGEALGSFEALFENCGETQTREPDGVGEMSAKDDDATLIPPGGSSSAQSLRKASASTVVPSPAWRIALWSRWA